MSKVMEKILELLQAQAETAVGLIDIITSDRSTSYRKARRSLLYGPPQFKSDWADWYRRRQAFHSYLNKLKREGLIFQKEKKKNAVWSITKSGLEKLRRMRGGKEKREASPFRIYQKKTGGGLVIIAYDIPERERRKRYWLRTALSSLGLKKLQQSVWAGKSKVPRELLQDLKDNGMLPYVHIFSVNKSGTIKEEEQG